MSLNNKQPVITVTISLNLYKIQKEILMSRIKGMEDEIREKTAELMQRIYPNLRIVDVGTCAALASSFMCSFVKGTPPSSIIEAVFLGYEKE